MNEVIDELKNYWTSARIKFRPPAPLDEIAAFEARNGVTLSSELREYFLTFDGLENDEADNDMISFWSLQRIGSVPEILGDYGGIPDYHNIVKNLPEAKSYFVFADHLCFSHVYAFRLTAKPEEESPVFLIADGETCYKLTDSFSDFIKKYLISPGDMRNAVLMQPDPQSLVI